MDITLIQNRFYLFNQTSSLLNARAEHYLPRFNYSACELWLCTEICHLVNYDDGKLQALSAGDNFIYNEDYKRDLTLYAAGKSDRPTILLHIEVKLIYPVSRSGFNESIDSLCLKLKNSYHGNYHQEGWVYLVWTQHYAISPEIFFASRSEWIQTHLAEKTRADDNNNLLSLFCTGLQDIADGTINWRGEEKRIVVKALAFSFGKSFREIYKDIKQEWALAFDILARR